MTNKNPLFATLALVTIGTAQITTTSAAFAINVDHMHEINDEQQSNLTGHDVHDNGQQGSAPAQSSTAPAP